MRFVIVGTLKRGALDRPFELLDDAGEMAAFSRWRQDVSRKIRAEWELDAMLDARVVWNDRDQWSGIRDKKKPVRHIGNKGVARMLELAARARVA